MAGKIRYSVTLLSYANKDLAVNDEMMIDKSNGSLYYKRADGKIIQCSSAGGSGSGSSLSFGGSNIYQGIANTGASMANVFTGDSSNGLFAVTEQTLETPMEITTDPLTIDNTFYVSPRSNKFFVDVMTRTSDVLYTELITFLRNGDANETPSKYNATIAYDIVGIKGDAEVTSSLKSYTANVTLNALTPIDVPEEFQDAGLYDRIKVTIKTASSTVNSFYDPAVHSGIQLYRSIMPNDDKICFEKVDLAYFTINTDTIFVDDHNSVTYITDVVSALSSLTTSNPSGYINSVIQPSLVKLYNAGLSASSSYIKEFEVADWTTTDNTTYTISIPKSTHLLIGEIIPHVYCYEDGLYTSGHGTGDNINYKLSCNPTTKLITITTDAPFKGKIILTDDAKFGDAAYVDSIGNLIISSALYSSYKQINITTGGE